VSISAAGLRDASGVSTGFIILAADITDRALLQAQLRQAQKMEAVGLLAGGVAHDFNNILTVIKSYASMLHDDIEAGDPRRDDVAEVEKAADRAAGLTRQLLAFSRQQVLKPQVLHLNDTVAEVGKMLSRLIGADVAMSTRYDPDLGFVKADAGQLEQVLMNLAVNARDAMPNGGTLTIETRNVELGEHYVDQYGGCEPGAYIMIAVSDTGHGMDAATQERIFEPFYTTKGIGKGTGLGLSTVYGIMKQSGGTVSVESAIGKGTTFRVYLPRVTSDAQKVEMSRSITNATPGHETVLLVDDDTAVREVTRRMLKRIGYEVIEATNGEHALSVCAEVDWKVDLVITDVVMPMMSGPDFARQLLLHCPSARILFMSGYTEETIRAQGPLVDRGEFLEKPFTPDGLAKRVREVLDGVAAA
jgi:signal transduction histidine kinase/CheY-like chemotaxis protein